MKVEQFFKDERNVFAKAFGNLFAIDRMADALPKEKRVEIPAPRLPEMNGLEYAGHITAEEIGFDDCPDDNARIYNLDYRIWFVEIETSNCEFVVYAFRRLDDAQQFATSELYRICSSYDRN